MNTLRHYTFVDPNAYAARREAMSFRHAAQMAEAFNQTYLAAHFRSCMRTSARMAVKWAKFAREQKGAA